MESSASFSLHTNIVANLQWLNSPKVQLQQGQEIWEEWTRQAVEDTEWKRKIKRQWRAREQAMARRGWIGGVEQDKDKVDRNKVYDRG